MHIGVIVDHPSRDLPGAAMIAHAGIHRGHRVSVIPMYEQGLDVPLLELDALIVNYARPTNLELVRAYVAQGIAVFVLDNEGGVMAEEGANSPVELARYIRDSGYAELLAGYFFWGSRPHQAAIEHHAMDPRRLHVTGCPRFDLASERWADTLSYPRKNYILLNTNFPLLNPLFSGSQAKERETVINVGWSPKYVDDIIGDAKNILEAILALVPKLAHANPDRLFLVRPHPFENADLYKNRLKGISNVVVDGQGSVLNAARNASCVLHVNCGSSIEAAMLHRVPISLEFLNTDRMRRHSSLPHAISWKASSLDDLLGALGRIDSLKQQFDFDGLHRKYIYPWFHENDGRAGDRIVEIVQRSSRASQWRNRTAVTSSLAASNPRSSLPQRVQALVANITGSALTSRLRARLSPVRRQKRVTAQDLETWLVRLAAHQGRPAPKVRHAAHPLLGTTLSSMQASL